MGTVPPKTMTKDLKHRFLLITTQLERADQMNRQTYNQRFNELMDMGTAENNAKCFKMT